MELIYTGRGVLLPVLCRPAAQVNARLGKPAFNCDLVEARWVAGAGRGAGWRGYRGRRGYAVRARGPACLPECCSALPV